MGIKQIVRTVLGCCSVFCILFGASGPTSGAVISPGTPTTNVPDYLTDGSYWFGITVALGPDQFLLPVQIAGAVNLQTWQFDLLFDENVVAVVDPLDGTSGIYGAPFTSDPNSLSSVLAGFPPFVGLVDDVAGSYPLLNIGPSGDGVLAYVLFQFLPGQETNNPNFSTDNESVFQVPEPSTLALLLSLTLIFPLTRRRAARI